jgi:uncharacterized protein involved in exopolysaccharide biosynthesis
MQAENSIDLRLVLVKARRRRWLLAGTLFVFTAAGVLLALTIRPVYRATTLLAAAAVDRQQSGVASMLGQLGGLAAAAGIQVQEGDRATQEALAVLQSREFTERFFSSSNALVEFFPTKWDRAAGRWKEPPSVARAYRRFDRDVRRVTESRKTGLITLQVDWTDRNIAGAWANALVRQLNAEMRARAMAEADKSLAFLEKERARTGVVEIQAAINRLIEAQIKQRMLASVNEDYAFRVVDRATPPDLDDPVRPNKLAYAIGGLLLGVFVGVALVLLLDDPPLRDGSATDNTNQRS